MVHTTCAVRECYTSSRINKDLRFHQFPHSEERCKLWIEACGRPDLVGRTSESLKNTYICSLHFELCMYGRRSLKKTATPTLLLPTKDTIHTQTDSKDKILNIVVLNNPQRHMHTQVTQKPYIAAVCSLQHSEDIDMDKCIAKDKSSQTPGLTDPRERRHKKQLNTASKRLRFSHKSQDVGVERFWKGCDNFLSPKLSAIVKAQMQLKQHCMNNRYSRDFKLFCLNIYRSSPLAYRFLSKIVSLPSKSSLTNMYLPTVQFNELMWDAISATVKHMSLSEKECMLCMDEMYLKLNDHTKEDKIFRLHDLKGHQNPLARYALTLMLRGITSEWKLPIGFSFITSCITDQNRENQLITWIMNTARRLLQLGFNIRAFLSDLGSNFLAFSKSLGISERNSCFEIEGHTIYYMFDVPPLIKCVRNALINYDFEFDGGLAQWKDIVNMYERDKTEDNRFAPHLSDAHVHPNRFQRQKIRFAIQIFSYSVVAALRNYKLSGTVQIADGTLNFVETMTDLFDLLNSTNVTSSNLYTGTNAQEALLERSQHLLSSIKVKSKRNGRDVTSIIKRLNAFNVTINSIRQLCSDMKSEGYDCILTRRLNNDCLETFFGLVRQSCGKCGKPTSLEYTRAFQKHFMCQILNLSDATNRTEDFDGMLSQFVKFGKNTPVKSTQVHRKRNKRIM